MGAGSWTESEDQILRREYTRQDIENPSSTTRWDVIARSLPGRTSRDVRKRWVNVLQNQFNKGAWTRNEDDRLRNAVQVYGTRWVIVAKDVGTRSADQCSKRWNQRLDPALVHSQWTQDNIELLFRAVSFHGPNWSTIQQVHFPRCPSNSIKNQHAIVSRNYERLQAVLASISDAATCCQNAASCPQGTSTPSGLQTPLSDTSLWNFQSFPWPPALPDPVGDSGTSSMGSLSSELYSSQLDIRHSSLPSDINSTFSTLFDPTPREESQEDPSSPLAEDLNTGDSSSPASTSPGEVSLVIQNPDENLIARIVQQLVTAKVDFKVVQSSN